jgi:hypothetical protein
MIHRDPQPVHPFLGRTPGTRRHVLAMMIAALLKPRLASGHCRSKVNGI